MANEPVSPELALVSPELAAQARAALPDRPWEAFAPPIRATGGIVRLPGPRPAPVVQRTHRRAEQMLAFFPVILLAAFIALLIVGSLPGMTDRPTLVPAVSVDGVVPPADGAPLPPAGGIDSDGVSNDSPAVGG